MAIFHHEELQQECKKNGKSLAWYAQQGWEAMNKEDNIFINKHTTKGAKVGRHPKDLKRKSELIEEQKTIMKEAWREELEEPT